MAEPLRWRRVVPWVAVGLCVSVAVLTWFGLRAIRQWRESSVLLMQQRADEAANILAAALTRDMQAVQRRVLASADWIGYLQDSPSDLSSVASSAFARYPYPDTFFAIRNIDDPAAMLFFMRTDRMPAWIVPGGDTGRVPVAVLSDAVMGARLLGGIRDGLLSGRRFAIFELSMAGRTYQIVAHIRYGGPFQERLDGIFGFMVDLEWVRANYFEELTRQIAQTAEVPIGVVLSVTDERGIRVASSASTEALGPTSRHTFRMMFFDPLLVAATSSEELSPGQWTVEATAAPDPTLAAAVRGADRTVVIAALAAVALAFGLVMIARGVSVLEKASALRADFVSSVTHELKTPLATIRAVGDTLVSGRITALDAQRNYAQLVVQECKRLARLIDNLLAVARITDVTQVYWFEPLAVEPLIQKTVAEFAPQLESAGFTTSVQVPPDLPSVCGDRTALTLALENLIDNAIRYSPGERCLTIVAAERDGKVRVSVADRGSGIPPEQIPHVTEKFFRGGPHSSKGSGLGLAIVRRVVQDHGGSLHISSVVNEGTTVEVTLPVARS